MGLKASINRVLGRGGLLLLGLCLLTAPAWAQRGWESAETDRLDVVLVLDSSGSMLLTDPLNLRHQGAKLFLQFLRAGDRLALLEFADGARVLRPLTEYSPDQAAALGALIDGVKPTGEYTDLLAPLKAAEELFQQGSRLEANRAVILLTDGKMEPNPKVGRAEDLSNRLLHEYLPRFKTQGIIVYTLAFSERSDQNQLAEIAAAANGVSWYTPTAEKIHDSFTDLLLAVKKPQIVPLTSKGFRIDAQVEEATFYVNREPDAELSLISPAGRMATARSPGEGQKWFVGDRFEVITITNPEAGQWQVVGLPKHEGFATVLTNLKLETRWRTGRTLTEGTPDLLEAGLFEDKKPVVLPQMMGAVNYAFQVTPTDRVSEPIMRERLNDEGQHGDQVAHDGVFSRWVTIATPGEYRLRIIAMGPTFERSRQINFRVKPRMVAVAVVPAQRSGLARSRLGDGTRVSDSDQRYFQVSLSPEAQELRNLVVELLAVDAEGRRYMIPLTAVGGKFEAATAKLAREGEYRITASLKGEGRRGREATERSQEIVFVQETISQVAEEVVVIAAEPEPARKSAKGLLYLVMVMVVNGALGGTLFATLSKQRSEVKKVEIEGISPRETFVEVIKVLEVKVAQTEVDLSSEIFADTGGVVKKLSPAAAALVGAAVSPTEGEGIAAEAVADADGDTGSAVADATAATAAPAEDDTAAEELADEIANEIADESGESGQAEEDEGMDEDEEDRS